VSIVVLTMNEQVDIDPVFAVQDLHKGDRQVQP
jgi:hypothetical protein